MSILRTATIAVFYLFIFADSGVALDKNQLAIRDRAKYRHRKGRHFLVPGQCCSFLPSTVREKISIPPDLFVDHNYEVPERLSHCDSLGSWLHEFLLLVMLRKNLHGRLYSLLSFLQDIERKIRMQFSVFQLGIGGYRIDVRKLFPFSLSDIAVQFGQYDDIDQA